MLRAKSVVFKSIILFTLALCLVFSTFHFYADAEELPLADARDQLVRVLLSRLGIRDRMDLTLDASYRMTTEKGVDLHFQPGCELAFLMRDASIYLYYQGMALDAGGELKLERTQDNGGFYLTNYPALYQGDLTLRIVENALQPVLTIHVEDYLLGVVPHEMGDSFPLEALKAQAVAARTYALRNQASNEPYDVVDTTNDQVFKGYLSGSPVSEQAVKETRGICGFYKGKLALCYYSASNGGQMERVETVWPDLKGFDYYTFGEDPYDVENPQSIVRRLELKKKYDAEAPYALRRLLSENLTEMLNAKGYDPVPECIRIDEVLSAAVEKPAGKNNKRMTALKLMLRISGRTRQKGASIRLIDSDVQEVSLFGTESIQTPAPDVYTENTTDYLYGAFEPFAEEITLEVPIFPDAENVLSLNVTTGYQNEIWNVVETEDAFTLEVRRYGHGVGMSQRGAQTMAAVYEKTYQDILGFYYPGMKLMQYPEYPAMNAEAEEALLSTAGPAPSPTPRPTLMPMTMSVQKGQWVAEVTGIADDSSLNLRQDPSLNAVIVMRLYKGQRLLVLERSSEEGWVKVKTDAAEGYVMESFLTRIP